MMRMKRILTLCLVFCLTLAMIPAVPAQALTLQEQSWLEYLRPDVPKLEGSYPAYLTVSMPNGTSVKLNGTCGVGGSLTDDEIIDVLKRACSSVEGYKDPQNAVNDVVLVAAVKEKLKFTHEDMDQLQQNFLALSGFDKVADLLNLTMPGVGGSDMASIAADIVQNGKPGLGFLNPIPDSIGGFAQGLIINGIFVSWEEFQRDKDKYKDIVNMSQANARLRAYYGRVDELVRDAMSEKGVWTISITDQQVVDYGMYLGVSDFQVPLIVSADIELVKDDGSYGNIGGTYIGGFKVDADADFSEIDTNYHNVWAEKLNSTASGNLLTIGGGTKYSGVSTIVNQPSEMKFVLESTQTSVNLALPEGVNRTVFELPLDTTVLDATYHYVIDYVSSVQRKEPCGCTQTLTDTIINEDDGETLRSYGILHTARDGACINQHGGGVYSSPTDDTMPSQDIRNVIKLTLVVDMLG